MLGVVENEVRASATPGSRAARKAYAARRWAELRDRLASTTPHDLARAVLATAVVGGTAAITVATWPTLLPFVVGGLIAYLLLPVVDSLDTVMPRFAAAAIAVFAMLAGFAAAAVIVVPPLVNAFAQLAVDIPSAAQLQASIDGFREQLSSLPEGSAAALIPILVAGAKALQDVVTTLPDRTDELVQAALRAVLNTVGAVLGLIVLPTWMLGVMSEKRRARLAVDARLAPWLRKDLWAILAIIDRAVGTYLRGYVVTAGLIGILTYIGLNGITKLGGPVFQEPLALAVLAGVTQLLPVVGALLGIVPALLLLPFAPDRALTYALTYLAARLIGSSLLGSRLMNRQLGVHPAILVPAVVVLGQFGLLWLLLSAPIVSAVADLIRYVHGRLSDPPLPAGVLPRTATYGRRAPVITARVPSVYRHVTRPAPAGPAGGTATAPAGRG
jgi:predicted PurR-regulated permease PerM